MSTPRHRRRERPAAAVVLLGVLGLLAASSPAAANSYHDFLCRIPYGPSAGRAAPTDDVTYATAGTFVFAGNSCSGGGALYASMSGETTQPYGTTALNTFTAPGGLTISGFTLWRYEADGPSQPYGSPASNLDYSPGPPSVQGLCTDGCARGNPSSPLSAENAVSVGSLGGVTQIQWSAACGGGPGGRVRHAVSRGISRADDGIASAGREARSRRPSMAPGASMGRDLQ